MPKTHFFNFNSFKPQKSYPGGSRASLTDVELPILDGLGISLAILKLAPGHRREPHWHPNAGELGYCIQGKALITVFSPGNQHDTFTVEAGEIFFVPKGYIHYVANTGDEELQVVIGFSHALPEDIDLSAAIHSMSDRVLGATFATNPSFFAGLKKGEKDVFITGKGIPPKPEFPSIPSRFKFDVNAINPQIESKGGSARIANSYTLPTLEDIAMFNLHLNVNGVREPHWHPNAHELNYVIRGKAFLRILSPGGHVDEAEIGPGEGSFIPASYFHHIENAGKEDLHMAVFFSNAMPNDIGISGALSAYSDEDLAAVFKVPVSYFANFKRIQKDVMVVPGSQ